VIKVTGLGRLAETHSAEGLSMSIVKTLLAAAVIMRPQAPSFTFTRRRRRLRIADLQIPLAANHEPGI
jgi:hypothetical protein